ncbi:MAG: hypothetical protein QXW47_11910, partial [Candidatus Jordarchaeales archaeon]
MSPKRGKRLFLRIFSRAYSEMVEACLDRAIRLNVTSRRKLHEAIYKELRAKYPSYPSHYVYTAITLALSMFKSYRRLSRRRKEIGPPRVEKISILLDDAHLFW